MKVLIIDDHPSMQEVLASVARKSFEEVLIYCEETLEAAKRKIARLEKVDLVLLDLGLPGFKGVEAFTHLRDYFPRLPVVVVSACEEASMIARCIRGGALGYIPKNSRQKVMVAALRLVRAGGMYIPPQLLVDEESPRENMALSLTERQREVLRLLLKGHSNARIADELDIAEGTVKQHAHAIFEALGVSSRAQLFAIAARGGVRHDGTPITDDV